jgi:hypothetical protein
VFVSFFGGSTFQGIFPYIWVYLRFCHRKATENLVQIDNNFHKEDKDKLKKEKNKDKDELKKKKNPTSTLTPALLLFIPSHLSFQLLFITF